MWTFLRPPRSRELRSSAHPNRSLGNETAAFFILVRSTFRSPAFLVQDTVVWGFTGGILNKLFDELGWSRDWDRNQEMLAPL